MSAYDRMMPHFAGARARFVGAKGTHPIRTGARMSQELVVKPERALRTMGREVLK
jgi:hypothetical protein